MKVTKEESKCLKEACKIYKELVGKLGPDGTPGLNDAWSEEDYYKSVTESIDEFRKELLEHPFFSNRYKSVVDIFNESQALFLYCLQNFLNKHLPIKYITLTDPNESGVIATPKEDTGTEDQNRKDFLKEVLDGVPRKKYLKDFLTDMHSYKQYRDDIVQALLFIDWDKIHRVMKRLGWVWSRWEDEFGETQEGTVPSAFGIREFAMGMIRNMEKYIMDHPEEEYYACGCGGFELEMKVYDEPDELDDYNHRVRFVIRFVVEQYDNGA